MRRELVAWIPAFTNYGGLTRLSQVPRKDETARIWEWHEGTVKHQTLFFLAALPRYWTNQFLLLEPYAIAQNRYSR